MLLTNPQTLSVDLARVAFKCDAHVFDLTSYVLLESLNSINFTISSFNNYLKVMPDAFLMQCFP